MKSIFSLLVVTLISVASFAQNANLQSTDYVIEVTLSNSEASGDLELRYSDLVSNTNNVLVVKTSKDKSSFAEKELRSRFPMAKVELLSGEAYMKRNKASNK